MVSVASGGSFDHGGGVLPASIPGDSLPPSPLPPSGLRQPSDAIIAMLRPAFVLALAAVAAAAAAAAAAGPAFERHAASYCSGGIELFSNGSADPAACQALCAAELACRCFDTGPARW